MPIVKFDSWVSGEINPALTEDVNNPLYFNSALNIENLYISKTQILRRLPSTESIEFNPITTNSYQDIISTKYNGVSYIIGWLSSATDSTFTIYKFNVTTCQLDLVAVHTLAGITEKFIDFVTYDKSAVFTYEGRPPALIADITVTTSAALTNFSFINQPTIDFGDVDYSNFTFQVTSEDAETAVFKVTGTNVTTLITQEWVGGMLFALGDNTSEFLGQGKIVTIAISGAFINITLNVIHTFAKDTFKGSRVVLQKPIFFNNANMPKRVGFFQARLYFGNTLLLPMLITGSRINIINDFNVGKGLPAEAIVYILNDNTSSEIKHIIGSIALFIFSDNNEHLVIPSIQNSITPNNFNAQKLSDWGSNDNKPLIFSDDIIFTNKTSRKILKILSQSATSFITDEVTKGMEVEKDITGVGIIDDALVDTKLLAFTHLDSTRLNLITIQQGKGIYGLTKYDYFPLVATIISNIKFGQIGNKTLMIGIKNNATIPVLSLFTENTTGLTQVERITTPASFTPTFDTYYFNPTTGEYILGMAGTPLTIPTGYTFAGFRNDIFFKSVPLISTNTMSWDRKEISYVFCSYINSARFKVNGIPTAFPTLKEIASTQVALKTNYIKINTNTNVGKFNYIIITSDQPQNVEIQAIGYDISETIMT